MHVIRPNPIYVVGDSQAVVFEDRVLLRPDARPYVARGLWCGLRGGELADEHETLNEKVVVALRGGRLLVPIGDRFEAFHVSGQEQARMLAFVDQRTRLQPPVVLSCGALELVQVARDLPYDDIELPADLAERFAVAPFCRETLPGAASAFETLTLLHTRMTGLRYGLRALRRLGFARLAVLSVAPPTANEAVFTEVRRATKLPQTAGRSGPRLRYKLVLAMNDVLMTICREEGVDFIDRWPDQTEDGVARPGVLLDVMHLTGEEADRTLRALVAWAERFGDAPADEIAV